MGRRPYSQWAAMEFVMFASLMERAKTRKNQARLINALLNPIHNVHAPHTSDKVDAEIFSVCSNKFAAISLCLLSNYNAALSQNSVARQHNILNCLGLLSAVQTAVGRPSQFVVNGPVVLTPYMLGDPPIRVGVQVNAERMRADTVESDGGVRVHISAGPQTYHVVVSDVLSHKHIQDWVAKATGRFVEHLNTETVTSVFSAAGPEFLSRLIDEIPDMGIVGSAVRMLTNGSGNCEREDLEHAQEEPYQLACVAAHLQLDSVAVFDGSARQQMISLPTAGTDGQLEYFEFETPEEVFGNLYHAVERFHQAENGRSAGKA